MAFHLGPLGICPWAKVLVVSRFPEFLPLMRHGVQRFVPHVATVDAAILDAEDHESRLAGHDVVVFATGAETVLAGLAPDIVAIEYPIAPTPEVSCGEAAPRGGAPRQVNRKEAR